MKHVTLLATAGSLRHVFALIAGTQDPIATLVSKKGPGYTSNLKILIATPIASLSRDNS